MEAGPYPTISVPPAVYPAVVSLIHAYFQEEPIGSAPSATHGGVPGGAVEVPGQGRWTTEMLRTVKESCPYDAPLIAIDAVAVNAGRMTFYEDIVRESGLAARVFQARMGAFSKFTNKNFGRKTWPFEWGYVGNRIFYRMPGELADQWLTL